MTMATTKQLQTYVRRHFPALHLQGSAHGCNRGSLQVYDGASRLVLDVDTRLTEWGMGEHDVSRAELGVMLRERQALAA
jgi:hypothetical protein